MSSPDSPAPQIDLGLGHVLRWLRWAPDDLPGNRERYGFPLPVIERAGASISHPRKDGTGDCDGTIHFDLPEVRRAGLVGDRDVWQVEKWDPLTLSPSILCTTCGDHGHVRDGRWVPS